jgi:hypothetical protein
LLQLFALWSIIHFVIIYSVSRFKNTLNSLKNLYAITILDWIFIPFNFLIAYSIDFSWTKFAIFIIISLIAISFLHYKWHKLQNKPDETKFFTSSKGLTVEGWIHFIFMTIQTSLVLTVIISKAIYPYYLYSMICLLLYFIGYLLIISLVRRIRLSSKVETPLIIFGIIVLIIRILVKY